MYNRNSGNLVDLFLTNNITLDDKCEVKPGIGDPEDVASNVKNNGIYFILSSEINAYQKQEKVISITSEMI